ncbi:hypothetical protein ACHAXR_008995 [Thalassiosira sp. AJA248-18]
MRPIAIAFFVSFWCRTKPSVAADVLANCPTSITRQLRLRETSDDKNIALRVGVFLAPPFAMYDSEQGIYNGFLIDFLCHLQVFAQQDGYNLHFDLSPAPPLYNDALDLVANDCNTTNNTAPLEECQQFDLIVGDYYATASRSVRVNLSPPWLHTTISSVKTVTDTDAVVEGQIDVSTLTELQARYAKSGTACVPEGTSIQSLVMEKFPAIKYKKCLTPRECISWLKDGSCSLYADDEMLLKYRVANDSILELSGEQFNTKYLVWPMSFKMDPNVTMLLEKWMYAAISVVDQLTDTYFGANLCPLGLSGKKCDQSCDRNHGVSDREGTCACQSAKWTGEDCSVEVKENLNLYPKWEIAVCYVFFGINTLACALCAVWVHWKRSNMRVEVSQPFFLNLILLGCVISSTSIIPLIQQSNGDGPVPGCSVFPWLYCVGFSVTFGTLFAKIYRVYKLFRASAQAVRISVTKRFTLITIVSITSVDVGICTIWTVVDRPQWTRVVTYADQFGEALNSVGFCTSIHWKAFVSIITSWHLILLLVSCHLCYKTRNISSQFVESKSLMLALVSHLQIYMISIPVLIIAGNDPSISVFIRVSNKVP